MKEKETLEKPNLKKKSLKSLNLRFYSNNTKNEAMICFSTEEEEAQVAITKINTYEGWRGEL